MKISDENILNFGRSIWTYGKLILASNLGKDVFCVVTNKEKINVGDVYVMRLGRNGYEVMNPCADQEEADRCNDKKSFTNIGRNCFKLIADQTQIDIPQETLMINVGDFVLVKCYPDMDGPGQSGWIIDNDVEGETNQVTLHLSNDKQN